MANPDGETKKVKPDKSAQGSVSRKGSLIPINPVTGMSGADDADEQVTMSRLTESSTLCLVGWVV